MCFSKGCERSAQKRIGVVEVVCRQLSPKTQRSKRLSIEYVVSLYTAGGTNGEMGECVHPYRFSPAEHFFTPDLALPSLPQPNHKRLQDLSETPKDLLMDEIADVSKASAGATPVDRMQPTCSARTPTRAATVRNDLVTWTRTVLSCLRARAITIKRHTEEGDDSIAGTMALPGWQSIFYTRLLSSTCGWSRQALPTRMLMTIVAKAPRHCHAAPAEERAR